MKEPKYSQADHIEHLNQSAAYLSEPVNELVSCWDCGKDFPEESLVKFTRLHGTTCAYYCQVCFNELKGGV